MSKFPRAGEVNTRMVPDIGAEKAAEVHKRMAEYIINVANKLDSVRSVVHIANSSSEEANHWLGSQEWVTQVGDDLGERMANAVSNSLEKGAKKILVVGTDCPSLNVDVLEQVLEVLDESDAVYIPAHDGGYVLVGMKTLHLAAFQNVDWGSSKVLEQSLQNLDNAGVCYQLLDPMSDVDHVKDIPKEFL